MSDSAFSVPPQQLITNDGGIIEIGAEVQYGITDVVVMVREVADHQAEWVTGLFQRKKKPVSHEGNMWTDSKHKLKYKSESNPFCHFDGL